MSNDQINGLIDIALQLKQHIENRDIEKIARLFDPNAKINIFGRFYTIKVLLNNLSKILAEIEQPSLDITSIEESELGRDNAFVTYNGEITWIDKSWEEITQAVALSLELKKDRVEKKENWLITGFTLARSKKITEIREVPIFPGHDEPRPPGSSGPTFLDGLFSFWY